MRLTKSFVLLFATVAGCVAMLMLATSCANHKPATMRYSPPSFAPVQQKITDASSAIGDVSAAIATAKAINTDVKVGHALTLAEARARDAKVALTAAGEKTLLVDSAVRNQTELLNNTITEKNDAITGRDSAVRKYHGLKFFVCLLAAGAVLSLAWRFRALLLFIPPPYNLVALGALPLITFTVLWIRL